VVQRRQVGLRSVQWLSCLTFQVRGAWLYLHAAREEVNPHGLLVALCEGVYGADERRRER
jgi:hypothetical protein